MGGQILSQTLLPSPTGSVPPGPTMSCHSGGGLPVIFKSGSATQPKPRPSPAHAILTLDSRTQVNVGEALGCNRVSCVLVYALQAQAGQLRFIEEPRLERG